MPPSKHVLLGASKAHQWMNCPPSAKWELSFPETKTSESAAEGTLAHAVAEEHLRKLLDGKKPTTSAKLKREALYRPAMEEHVGVYVEYVMEHLAQARRTTPDAMLLLEERVDFSKYVPDGFGTTDALLIADGTMEVFDLKYGKGVPVGAAGNPQIRLYALGALASFDGLYDIREVIMHIVQPRLSSITSETMSADDLRMWGALDVSPVAALAAEGKGEHKAGEHCRWCRCKHVCRIFAMAQLEIAKQRFSDPGHEERKPDELSAAEISEILRGVDGLVRWAKSIKEWALDQCVNHGAAFPGFKLVEGRSNRIIADELVAAQRLSEAGFGMEQTMKLRGLTELEELVGEKRLSELLDGMIFKPAGKPALAQENDKRPALSSTARAQAVFTPMDEE